LLLNLLGKCLVDVYLPLGIEKIVSLTILWLLALLPLPLLKLELGQPELMVKQIFAGAGQDLGHLLLLYYVFKIRQLLAVRVITPIMLNRINYCRCPVKGSKSVCYKTAFLKVSDLVGQAGDC
jgi:hypothetical protein